MIRDESLINQGGRDKNKNRGNLCQNLKKLYFDMSSHKGHK
jgi:hypothetical protein